MNFIIVTIAAVLLKFAHYGIHLSLRVKKHRYYCTVIGFILNRYTKLSVRIFIRTPIQFLAYICVYKEVDM